MVVAAFVMILNETIVSIALPDLATTMSVTASTVQWLVSGFLVTMAVVIPTTGFILDRFTPRAVFLAAVGSFAVGTLVCGLAPDFAILLTGRMVQACGTAVMVPLVMTTVMRLVPANRRGATMGTISIVIGVAPAIGPTVGGAILAGFGWRWMFYLVLILAVAVLATGIAALRVPSETRPVPLDVASVLLSAVGFAGVVYGLSSIGAAGGVIPAWASITIGILALAAFAWRQHRLGRRARPLLDLRTLTHRRFDLALVMSVFMFMALLGAGAILLPIYLQTVLGHGTFVAGLALLPGGLAMAAVSRPVGNLYDRVGARPLVIPGAIGMTVALAIFAMLGDHAPLAAVIGGDVLMMGSLGLMITPLMTDALGALPDHLYSHGSAILTTLQQVAGALGGAVFVTLAALGSSGPPGLPDAGGLRLAFAVAAGISVGAIGVALTFPRRTTLPATTIAQGDRVGGGGRPGTEIRG
jgi:DHA2 family lincomycin resistance protein-like MFS transporter